LAAALALLAGPVGALAQAGPEDPEPAGEERFSPEACAGIESSAQRLECYDRAVGRDRLLADDEPAPAEPQLGPEPVGGGPPELIAPRPSEVSPFSLLDSRWELSPRAKLGTWSLRGYKPIFILPIAWDESPNESPSSPAEDHTVEQPLHLDPEEVKFQISFKTKVWEGVFADHGDLWFGYTQSSRWQLYNAEESRPFRETNYEPEVMLAFATPRWSLWGLEARLAGLSLNHMSNGRGLPLSRSWNRLIGMIGFERRGWTLVIRPWYRIPDQDDDNPDILDYLGRMDAQVVRRLHGHQLALLGRHSLRTGDRSHGALIFEWAFPIRGDLKGYFELFHGYGESLIDYNHETTRVGLGISLFEWY
jgi:phospholipase A1